MEHRLEKRLQIAVGGQLAVFGAERVGVPRLRGAKDHGYLQEPVENRVVGVLEVRVEGEQQVLGLVDHLVDPGVRAVYLVDHGDDRQLRLKGFAQDETGLGQRALGGVDEQDDAVDHRQPALDLPAEVGVARSVDDVDRHALGRVELGRGGPGVAYRRVLREDRDAFFTLQIARIHDPLPRFLNGGALAESSRLPQHGVDERCLAVVDVRNDGDVPQVITLAQ